MPIIILSAGRLDPDEQKVRELQALLDKKERDYAQLFAAVVAAEGMGMNFSTSLIDKEDLDTITALPDTPLQDSIAGLMMFRYAATRTQQGRNAIKELFDLSCKERRYDWRTGRFDKQ